jgi:uncharacterized protein (DUF58 family)
VVSRIEPRGVREVSYPVRSDVRGRFVIGPLQLRFADLFGLVELNRSFTTSDALIVTPPVVPLAPLVLGGDWAGGGDSHARSISTMGEDDVTTREYRHGDDLRRVHWRSTARYGELMVRREEQPWQNRGVLFLDTRASAHRGDGPASSLEWGVTAAASVGSHLARHGFGMRFLTDTGEEVYDYSADAMSGTGFEGMLLDSLAMVTPSSGVDLTTGLSGIRRGGGEGLVIAVLGALTDADLEALTRFRHHAAACVAIRLDTATWTTAAPAAPRGHGQTAGLLTGAGWRVLSAPARCDLRVLWREAAVGNRLGGASAGAPTGARR